jgi:hypothetical protein
LSRGRGPSSVPAFWDRRTGTKSEVEGTPMSVGKLLILVGIVFLVVGVLWRLGEKMGLGRLPGDIVIRGERSIFYFPLATSIVLSVLLSLVLWFVQRWNK